MVLLHFLIYSGLAAASDIWVGWETILFAAILGLLLIWISVWDFRTYTIPDLANLLLVLFGLAFTYHSRPWALSEHVFSIGIWGGFFLAVIFGFRAIRGYHGLGMGDAKLMAGAGALLGLYPPTSVVLAASLSGLIFGTFIWLTQGGKRNSIRQSAIAFGPFISVSIWWVWLFGPWI